LQRRNVLASNALPEVAERLWNDAVTGGALASGRAIGGLAAGQRADFAVLASDGLMAGLTPQQILASHLFARHADGALRAVWVAGRCRIRDGHHADEATAQQRFVAARSHLLQGA